jgi:uncharacterized OsmC-like protein
MGQDAIKRAIDAAVEYLTSNPDEAKYTDSLATARLTDPSALLVTVSGPDGASMTTDMPTSVGGGNTAPSPGWQLRAAEASCVATLIAMRAAQVGVALAKVEVTVDSESNDRGILGIGDESAGAVPAGPLRTRVLVRIGAPEGNHDQVRDIVTWAVDHCPVTDAVRRAVPLDLSVDFERA